MIGDLAWVLPVLPAICVLGVAILQGVGSSLRGDRLAQAGYAILAGSLGVGVLCFVALLSGAPVAALPFLPWIASATLFFWTWRRRQTAATKRRPARPERSVPESCSTSKAASWFFLAVVLASVTLVADRAMLGNGKAIAAGDEAHLWARKAKAMYAADGFGPGYRDRLGAVLAAPHQDYPLLNPLLQTFVFAHRGEIVDVENRLPIQLLALALVALAASALRRHGGPLVGAVLLVLLLTTAEARAWPRYVMADGMVALGFLAALDAWSRQRGGRDARGLLSLSLAFLVWSKSEGMMLGLCVVGAALVDRVLMGRRRGGGRDDVLTGGETNRGGETDRGGEADRSGRWGWAALLLPVAVVLAQAAFNRAHDFTSVVMSGMVGDSLIERLRQFGVSNLPTYLCALYERTIGAPSAMNLLLPLFAIVWCLHPRRLAGTFAGAGFAIVAAVLGYSLVYLSNDGPDGVRWHTGTSLDRVLFHLLPATAVWIAGSWRALTGVGALGPALDPVDSPAEGRDT